MAGAAIQREHAQTSGGRDIRLTPVREQLVGGVRDALLVIQGAVGLVLLIACANVSSLLIARATGRRRELAIRAALGAGRGHLIRQLLAESLVLGVAGGIGGLLLSSWLVVLLVKVLPRGLPRTDAIAPRRDRDDRDRPGVAGREPALRHPAGPAGVAHPGGARDQGRRRARQHARPRDAPRWSWRRSR